MLENDSVQEGTKPFKCDICNSNFSRKDGLKRHKSVHEGNKSQQCFVSRTALNRHIEEVHAGIKEYKCKTCEKQYTSKGNLNLHIRTVHEGKKPYSCEICDHRFIAPKDLSIHVATVHEGKKLFVCEIFGKDLTSNHYLIKRSYFISS